MKIAAVSDIHGNLFALEAVLADIRARGVDLIVNLGDLASGPLLPRATVERLQSLPAYHIRGNHERAVVDENCSGWDRFARRSLEPSAIEWIRGLPATMHIEDVLLCHGTPDSDLHYLLETVTEQGRRGATPAEVEARVHGAGSFRLALCGHSHVQRQVRLSNGSLVVNPGSVGIQAFVWDQPRPHRVESGNPHARYAVIERVGGGWAAEFIQLEYDWDAAFQVALSNGAAEFDSILRKGRIDGYA